MSPLDLRIAPTPEPRHTATVQPTIFSSLDNAAVISLDSPGVGSIARSSTPSSYSTNDTTSMTFLSPLATTLQSSASSAVATPEQRDASSCPGSQGSRITSSNPAPTREKEKPSFTGTPLRPLLPQTHDHSFSGGTVFNLTPTFACRFNRNTCARRFEDEASRRYVYGADGPPTQSKVLRDPRDKLTHAGTMRTRITATPASWGVSLQPSVQRET